MVAILSLRMAAILFAFVAHSDVLALGEDPAEVHPHHARFSLSITPTISRFAGQRDEEFLWEPGFRVSGQAKVGSKERFVLGLAYERRAGSWLSGNPLGGSSSCDVEGPDFERELSLGYVLVTGQLVLYPYESQVRPYFTVGADAGYVLFAKESIRERCTGDLLDERSVRRDLNDGVADLSLGGGVEFPIARRTCFLQFRWIEGLTQLEPPFRASINGDRPDLRSRVLGLELGTWF